MMFLFLMVCLFFGDFTSQIRVCSIIYNSQNVFFLWNIFKKIGIYLSRKHSSVSKFPQMTQIWLHNRPRHQYLLLKCFKWPKNIQGHIAIYLIPNERFYFKIEHFLAKTLFFCFFSGLKIEPRASHTIGKYYIRILRPLPSVLFFNFWEIESQLISPNWT